LNDGAASDVVGIADAPRGRAAGVEVVGKRATGHIDLLPPLGRIAHTPAPEPLLIEGRWVRRARCPPVGAMAVWW
jgi:hypothetical protein